MSKTEEAQEMIKMLQRMRKKPKWRMIMPQRPQIRLITWIENGERAWLILNGYRRVRSARTSWATYMDFTYSAIGEHE